MPEQPGFNPDYDQARRQEFGAGDELLQPPTAATIDRITKLADRFLKNNPEAYTALTVDFKLYEGVYASVGYGRSGDQTEEKWSLIIERYDPEAAEGAADADDDPHMVAEFGSPEPILDDDTAAELELEDPDEEDDDEGFAEEDDATELEEGMVYDPDSFRQVARWAHRSGQPLLLRDALEALIEARDNTDAAEAARRYDLAASKLLELGRQIAPAQADQVSQQIELPQPDGSVISIRQYLQPHLPPGQQQRLLIQCTGDSALTLKLLGDEPPRFTNVRPLAAGDWADVPTREWRSDSDEIDEKIGSESDYDLDLASEGNVREVLARLQEASEA